MSGANTGKKPKIAILISGTGSNMKAIIEACRAGELEADPVVVISDNADAYGLETARGFGVQTMTTVYGSGIPRERSEELIACAVTEAGAEWIVLAGFMRVLTASFVEHFKGRIVNIHPSILPSFPGAHAMRDALEAGADCSGVTIHIVDELMDHGPILAQEEVPILPGDTEETLAPRVHAVEHRLYPRTLQQLFHEDI